MQDFVVFCCALPSQCVFFPTIRMWHYISMYLLSLSNSCSGRSWQAGQWVQGVVLLALPPCVCLPCSSEAWHHARNVRHALIYESMGLQIRCRRHCTSSHEGPKSKCLKQQYHKQLNRNKQVINGTHSHFFAMWTLGQCIKSELHPLQGGHKNKNQY